MADSVAFEAACNAIESLTALSRLEVRGTVRIVLRKAGLDSARVSPEEILGRATDCLESELAARGVRNAGDVCRQLRQRLSAPRGAPANRKAI